jgi:hypothetical protein
MRRPATVFIGVVVIALVVLAIVALTDRDDEAFTIGVQPAAVVAELTPRDRACQDGIDVPTSFSAIELQVGTYRKDGKPLTLTVHRDNGSGPVLARGSLRGGYPDVSRQRIGVAPAVGSEERIAVCVEERGAGRTAVYGNIGAAAPSSALSVDDREVDADLTLVFHDSERSLAAELPDTFERAAVFKASWLGPWAFWLLALAVLVLVPGALVLALRQLRT